MGVVANVGVHPDREVNGIDLRAEVDYVPAEVARVDLRRVDLDDSDVLSKSEGTNTELERRSKDDVAEDALRRVAPPRDDLPVEGVKSVDRLLRRVPETLGLSTLVLSIVILPPPLHRLATRFLVFGNHRLPPNLSHNGRVEIIVSGIAEEDHFVLRVARIPVIDHPVVRQARWEYDMPRGDEEELAPKSRPGDIEATCSSGIAPLISADGETESDCQRVGNRNKRIRGEDRREKLRADRLKDARFADLYLNVFDAVVVEDFACVKGHSATVLARERLGCDSNPEDDGGGGLADYTDTNHVEAGPVHLHGSEAIDNLVSEASLPKLDDRVLADGAEHLGRCISLGAGGLRPYLVDRASHKCWPGGQTIVVAPSLLVGVRGYPRCRALQRRGFRGVAFGARVRRDGPRRREWGWASLGHGEALREELGVDGWKRRKRKRDVECTSAKG